MIKHQDNRRNYELMHIYFNYIFIVIFTILNLNIIHFIIYIMKYVMKSYNIILK